MVVSARLRRLFGRQLKIGWAHRVQNFLNAGSHLARFGMPANGFLREDELAIDQDIKDAARAGNKLPTADEILNLTFVQNFVRQTDGIRLVSSSSAILDDDIHSAFLHDEAFPIAKGYDAHIITKGGKLASDVSASSDSPVFPTPSLRE